MIIIRKELLDHIGQLIGYPVTQEELLKDKLALHRCINLFKLCDVGDAEKSIIPELESIDKHLHPAEMYRPISPGHYGMPAYDEIEFYCGMSPDYRYWTMDITEKGMVYRLWDYVYATPKHAIKRHIDENLKEYAWNNTKKLEWLKCGVSE